MYRQLRISITSLSLLAGISFLDCGSSSEQMFVCGNAVAEEKINKAVADAKGLVGDNRPLEALQVLLPEVSYNGLADNAEVIRLAVRLLHRLLPEEVLRDSLEKSIQSIRSEKAENIEGLKFFYMTFLGAKIPVYHEKEFLAIMEPKYRQRIQTVSEYQESFRRSKFYLSIMNLTAR